MGACIDTCHLFAAGYPLGDAEEYAATMTQFDEIVGIGRLKIIHANDSKRELGSRVDRHEHIGEGEIGLEGFRNVVNDERLQDIPVIIETPKGEDLAEDVENLRVLRSLVAS
jgi:deoxyribonuclease-4